MMRPVPVRRPGLLLVAATTLVLLLPGLVAAHAELETSSPKDTELVPGTPAEIWGTYSEAVKVEGSSLVLQDAASGKELARGGVDPDDDKRMVITPVPELALGDYIVKSTTVSADDNDIDREQWIFTVVAVEAPTFIPSPSVTPTATPAPTPSTSASASPSASASASPTAAPSLSPTPAPSPSGSGSTTGSGTDVLLPILVVLVLLAVLGGYLYTRRGNTTTPAP
jgi:methionine-rich copper-binding protein CopC